ncbi:MAG TPA: ABC transporter permease [Microcella sp.]|nr:ABC transporter permease [Microcella sp.]
MAIEERNRVTTASVAVSVEGPSGIDRRRRAPRSGRRRLAHIALGAILPIAIFALWQAASTFGWIPAYRLPSPESLVVAAADLAERGLLGLYVAISTQRVLIGFAIGAVVGLVLGAIVGLSRRADGALSPTIGALRAVPSLAWAPLLLLYLGFGEDSKVVLIAIGAAFPVYTTVAGALSHVDRQLVELGRAYGYTGVSLLTTVQLPAIVPAVISGLRLALAQAWLFLVAAEIVGSSMGLGFLLVESQNNGRIDRLFLAIVLLAILGKSTDALVGLLEKHLLKRWG